MRAGRDAINTTRGILRRAAPRIAGIVAIKDPCPIRTGEDRGKSGLFPRPIVAKTAVHLGRARAATCDEQRKKKHCDEKMDVLHKGQWTALARKIESVSPLFICCHVEP